MLPDLSALDADALRTLILEQQEDQLPAGGRQVAECLAQRRVALGCQ